MKICREQQPPEFTIGENHTASCWRLHPDFPGSAAKSSESKEADA
jgi:oligopeptide transport system ATP-binding protein